MKLVPIICLTVVSFVALSSAKRGRYLRDEFDDDLESQRSDDFPMSKHGRSDQTPAEDADYIRDTNIKGRPSKPSKVPKYYCPPYVGYRCCTMQIRSGRSGKPRVIRPPCNDEIISKCCAADIRMAMPRADIGSAISVVIVCIQTLISNLLEFKLKIPNECCNISIFKHTCHA